jgi:hypothetical protein
VEASRLYVYVNTLEALEVAVPQSACHTTTLTAPLEMWAALDMVRASRAKVTGRRPSTRELLLEAVMAFLEREKKS